MALQAKNLEILLGAYHFYLQIFMSKAKINKTGCVDVGQRPESKPIENRFSVF